MISVRSILFTTLLAGCALAVSATLAANEPVTLTSGGLKFEERLIWGEGKYVFGITATDIDQDGDLDFSTAGVHSDVLIWHENDGQSNLKQHIICQDEPGYLEQHEFRDLNGDGHLDVVIVKNKIGHVIWFENNGTPGDGKLWKRHVISTDFMRAYDISLSDLDGDGDPDIAASAYTGDCFSWFENPGKDQVNDEWRQHRFDQGKDIANTRTIVAADFNRDGMPDLLATGTYGGRVLWYENTGLPAEKKFVRRLIDDKTVMPVHGRPVDMDADGDLDVVMAFGIRGMPQENSHQVAWYENVGQSGTGAEWKKHFIGTLAYGWVAVTGDLDGDGDLDVVATGSSGGNDKTRGVVNWYENTGDPKGEWKQHAFKSFPEASQVIAVDFDQDGKLDIAATSEGGTAYWWRNLGPVKDSAGK